MDYKIREKSLLLFLFFLLFYIHSMDAQNGSSVNEKDYKWGLKPGGSLHWQNEGDFHFDTDFGWLFGMYFIKQRGKLLATSYEWQVMEMGYQINETTDPALDKIVINRTYIQVLLNLHLTPAKFIDFSVGGYAGIAVNDNEKWFYETGLDERDSQTNLRQLDAGVKLSATIWLRPFGLSAEYYNGILNTNINNGPDFVFTNRALAICLKFNIEE